MPDGDFGLCDRCLHQRIVPTPRGGRFSQCGLHFTDPRFAKYPRVPVDRCDGWEERPADGGMKARS